jgi:isopentenyldiphosphate isomerase
MDTEELFDIVDESGKIVGTAQRKEVHGNPALIHRSVHVLVLNGDNSLYLQKRGADKDIQPGKWDTSVGGHVGCSEGVLEAAKREMAEELGIENEEIRFLYEYIWRTKVETELVTSFLCRYQGGRFRIDISEIEEGRFWSFAEIGKNIGKGVFTPNFEEEFECLKKFLKQQT